MTDEDNAGQQSIGFSHSQLLQTMNQRPLLVRFGALGDMTILTVAIRALHERSGQTVDIVASGPWTTPLLQGQPGVGDIYVVRSRNSPYLLSLDQQRLVKKLRQRGRGPTWVGEVNDRKAIWLLACAGWNADDICSIKQLASRREHYCDHLLRFSNLTPPSAMHSLMGEVSWSRPHCQLTVSIVAQESADAWLQNAGLMQRPFILIQAGNKRTMRRFGVRQRVTNTKYWPEAYWAEVLRSLRQLHPDSALLLAGVPQEAGLNDDILRLANVENTFNIASHNSIPLLVGLAARAQGMISVDTGPGHVAAAVGCKVVTLFGTMDPAFYVPRGPANDAIPLIGHAEGKQSMLNISPEQVTSAWRRLMDIRD